MIRLSFKQVDRAATLAMKIMELESAKDTVQDKTLRFEYGFRHHLDVPVSCESVRAEIDRALADATLELRQLGIELLP